MAGALRKRDQIGLRVTVIFDCCISGSVACNDKWQGLDVSYINYSPLVDADSSQENSETPFGVVSTLRDSSMEKD